MIDASALGDRALETRFSTRLEGLTITGASPPDNNDGGAVFADGSAMGNALALNLEGVAMQGNFANGPGGDGGAVQISGGNSDDSLTITGSVLSGNDAGRHGGAIEVIGVDAIDVTGSTLSGNTAGSEARRRAARCGWTRTAGTDHDRGQLDHRRRGSRWSGPPHRQRRRSGEISRSVIAGNDSSPDRTAAGCGSAQPTRRSPIR